VPVGSSGGDVGHRQGGVAQKGVDPRADVDAGAVVADHRIAAVDRPRIVRLHPRHRIDDGGADAGVAHVAGQHGIAGRQHAAGLDAVDQGGDLLTAEHIAGPAAIAGVVGELHGVDRPDFRPQPLQRKHRAGVADMAVGHPRLNRQDVHRVRRNAGR